jgi:hypothetical protein
MPKPLRNAPVRPAGGSSRLTPAAQGVRQLGDDVRAARAERARHAEQLLASIAARKARIGIEFYEIGRELAELVDGEYHIDVGYPTFAAMIEGRKLLSRSAAWRFIAIFRSIPRKTANQLGPQRAVEWLQLLRLEAGPDATEADVQAAARRPAVIQGRSVADLTTRQLVALRQRSAARLAVAREDPAAGEAHQLARSLTQQLRGHGAKGAVVTARYSRSWRLRIDLGLDAAKALGKALG